MISKRRKLIFILSVVIILLAIIFIMVAKRQATYSGVWKVKEYRDVKSGEIIPLSKTEEHYPDRYYSNFSDMVIVLHKDKRIEIIDLSDESMSYYGTYTVKNNTLYFTYRGQNEPSLELDIVKNNIEFDLYKNYAMDIVMVFEQTN